MSDPVNVAIGFAFMAGLSVGFVCGMVALATANTRVLRDRIKAGVFDQDGVGYRITELDP